MSDYSEEEILLSYEGRKISDRTQLKGGYCGSCSIEIHRSQLNDPESWVHSSVASWIRETKPKQTIATLTQKLDDAEHALNMEEEYSQFHPKIPYKWKYEQQLERTKRQGQFIKKQVSALADSQKLLEESHKCYKLKEKLLAEKEAELKDVITSNAFLELIKEEQSDKLTTQAEEIEGLSGALEKISKLLSLLKHFHKHEMFRRIKVIIDLAQQTLKDTISEKEQK